ncbi:unnamed protein product [Psylliodes chrysocephalus]|uniref:Uncharacterized protein n=1 Tax=Psylliodes chrysocephalus TaxID=3402493 RepID=A0A9P0CI03_9CUCU|nr:unnamed protein product [Psylliodes chrysocephala]
MIDYDKGSFVRVSVEDKSTVIRKSSLCWLLDQAKDKVSSDRLRRFIGNRPKSLKPENLQVKSQIKTGDWCVFEYTKLKNNKCAIKDCLLGRVLSFGYLEPSSKILCPYWALVQSREEGIGCHCAWYSIDEVGILTAIDTDTKEICEISIQMFYSLSYHTRK